MTEHRPGSGGTEDNVRDEWDESQEGSRGPKPDVSKETVEKEAPTGGTGGVKENVQDEWRESQRDRD